MAKPGDLFVAFRGDKTDGHLYVADALRRGAYGALVQSPPDLPDPEGQHPVVQVASSSQALLDLATYWRSRQQIRVVGVTGSVGKTTAKETIASVLASRFRVLRTPANLNTEIGLAMSLMGLDGSQEIAVLEMGMHALGEIAQLAAIARPDIGVVTNVYPVHLERLGTIENIARAKAELVEALPEGGLAVLNADDARVRAMADRTPARSLLVGMSEQAELRATEVESLGLDGTACNFSYQGESLAVRMPTIGRHTVYPALAALAAAMHLGMSFRDAAAQLENLPPGPRLAVLRGKNDVTVLDDTYNASPASMIAALDLLGQMAGRRIAVLGDMLELGSYEEEGHSSVGRHAASIADALVVVGERARIIADAARAAGLEDERLFRFDDNDQVIAHLRRELRPGDYVLIKGSHAMQLDEVVAAVAEPHSTIRASA